MKLAFQEHNVPTADWVKAEDWNNQFKYPIVCKNRWGSRGRGNTLVNSPEEFNVWRANKNLSNYIIEKFYSYSREYRLHVTNDGYFYTCRKMIRNDVPENDRWHRHESNSVWVLETNELFDKPSNWNAVVEASVSAIKAVGLDIGAVDLKIQTNDKENPLFIVLETNSAPAFAEITAQKYKEELPKILKRKINE